MTHGTKLLSLGFVSYLPWLLHLIFWDPRENTMGILTETKCITVIDNTRDIALSMKELPFQNHKKNDVWQIYVGYNHSWTKPKHIVGMKLLAL